MARGVKEWPSTDVLQRKYMESWVIFEDPEGKLYQAWVDNCEVTHQGCVYYLHGIGPTNNLPVYYPIESGYYASAKGTPLVLERKFTPQKNFRVGVDGHGWWLHETNTGDGSSVQRPISRDSKIDLLTPLDRSRFLTRGLGIVCRKYLVTTDQIFYKGNAIGAREKNVIILDNTSFHKDLQTILGSSWLVS